MTDRTHASHPALDLRIRLAQRARPRALLRPDSLRPLLTPAERWAAWEAALPARAALAAEHMRIEALRVSYVERSLWPPATEPRVGRFEAYLLLSIPPDSDRGGIWTKPQLLTRLAIGIGLPINRAIRAAHGLVRKGLVLARGEGESLPGPHMLRSGGVRFPACVGNPEAVVTARSVLHLTDVGYRVRIPLGWAAWR